MSKCKNKFFNINTDRKNSMWRAKRYSLFTKKSIYLQAIVWEGYTSEGFFCFEPHKMKFSLNRMWLDHSPVERRQQRLRWMWACVRVWVAGPLLAAGFEVSGSLRALVCLIAFLSHWSAVAAILLQRLQWNCERQGLQSVTPWLSIKVMLPGNPVAWQHSWSTHRAGERASVC